MKRDVQSVVLVLIGAALLRISFGAEIYLRYVKAGLRPALIAAGAAVLLLGFAGVVRDGILRKHEAAGHDDHEHDHGHDHEHDHEHAHAHAEGHEDGHGSDDAHEAAPDDRASDHGHDHSKGPRIAWLLCLPVFALFLIAPPALGSYTAARSDNTVAKPAAKTVDAGFPALPPGDPLDMTLGDFGVRAVWDTADTLKGRNVRMIGFVTPGKNGTWYVTRLVISCCAADAVARKVEVRDAPAPPADTWVQVTGTWFKNGETGSETATPAMTATGVEKVATPKDPYE
ncbi:TIGR03943 family putative permease subunit [Yinghuangia seranimata]|uniref:TIGR03943 family putative permease subunit n=1 Tax=Yinghuangia seranimata TaxID=408067 RepID=UPI00248CF600|nr:TIGR03943 family protein [Yinghuangia seranimata]MDI2127488.1 TIGR03943 family protein [Yinghuangia seranimata]